MTFLEWMDFLRTMAPNLVGVLIITVTLGSAVLAVEMSEEESPAARHFVLLLGLGGVAALLVMAVLLRLALGGVWAGDLATTSTILAGLSVAWGLGAAVLGARLALGWVAIQRVKLARGRSSPTGSVERLVRQCAAHVGLGSMPEVIFSPRCGAPMAAGVVRQCVLLPRSMRDADERELRLVLIHELAHVRRRDCLAELAVQAMAALLWWNPLYWMVAGRVRVLREMACDRIVAFGCSSAAHYAELLVRFATRAHLPFGPGFAAVRMADRRSLLARVRHLTESGTSRHWHVPSIFPPAMSNPATAGFMLAAVFVAVTLDATILATLQEMFAE